MFQLSPIVLACALLAACAIAQQYPPPVTYDTILKSPVNPNITISYKRPNADTCTTAFKSQKQYTGYVNLPPFTLAPFQQDYSINTFFWFFESRTSPETAPLTIWLNGGPGSSSMIGLFQELGPCEVIQLPNGSYSTQSRLWGWDRSSNLLFIDQPTQTGFSYDKRVNASVDFKKDYPFMLESRMPPQALPTDAPAWRFMNGTFASGREDDTQKSTAIAARACWHFLQGFLSAFPHYNPGTRPNSTTVEPAAVNLFAESYGGIYGPTFADFFEDQNDRRRNGSIPAESLEVQLGSVGIVNGALDSLAQTIAVANFTHNNTYGINTLDLVSFQNAISDITSDNGCRGLVAQCRDRMKVTDPEGSGLDEDTNDLCESAARACNYAGGIVYNTVGRSVYDIRVKPEVGPGASYQEYLNTAEVLKSIGAQVNFTQHSEAVMSALSDIGDSVRGTQLSSLAGLLARGVRVAFIYGDADIICNWYGGQNASLELSRLVPSYSNAFPAAGYADIVVNSSYVGGQVRQYGNLSFSRIYDAGHLVPYYQPETAFTVFTRVIQGDDIGMGRDVDLSTFGTRGPSNSPHMNKKLYEPASTCWLRDTLSTCTGAEIAAIKRGQGLVKAGIWIRGDDDKTESTFQHHPSIATSRITTTSYVPLTGVFTATSTPTATKTSGASARHKLRFLLPRRAATRFPRRADSKTRNGLIGGLAAAGALLLSLITTLLCCHGLRHRKYRDGELPVYAEKDAIIATQVREEPIPSRRPAMPMESIAEASPRPSDDMIKKPKVPRRLSTYRNKPSIFKDGPFLVQRDIIRDFAERPGPPTPPQEPTPSEEPQLIPTAPPPEPDARSGPRMSSPIKRIKGIFRNKSRDSEVAQGPHENAEEDRSLTPPPRVATQPLPSRVSTSPLPSQAPETSV